MRNKKLGVIVPYRNRKEHLHHFKVRMSHYLKNNEISHEIFIVNQDDGKLFNRGMLLNIGFEHAKKSKCDYVVFHDVDMIPIEADYSYSDIPIHLSTNFVDKKTLEPTKQIFDEYFGGVTIFPIDIFEKINGYSNKYWGWGFEDDDLLFRCKVNGIKLNDLKIKNTSTTGVKLKFNGNNAYIQSKNFNNLLNFKKPLTLLVSYFPDEISLNHEKERDDFTIFSIPGFDTDITYNSFLRYTFQTFDVHGRCISIYSDIKTNYQTSIVVTFDPVNRIVTMFQDGKKVKSIQHSLELHDYTMEQLFYLGCAKDGEGNLCNFYKGHFNKFAVFSDILSDKEIETITSDDIHLTSNEGDYKSSKKLLLYYDTNFINNYQLVDLSGNQNNGIIYNCEIVNPEIDEYKTIKIPHRRNGVFYNLKHEENGFLDNKWKSSEIRWNQLRFHNEVYKNPSLCKDDGLSNLEYTLHGKEVKNNIVQLNVGI